MPDANRAIDDKIIESPIDVKLAAWGWQQIAGDLADCRLVP